MHRKEKWWHQVVGLAAAEEEGDACAVVCVYVCECTLLQVVQQQLVGPSGTAALHSIAIAPALFCRSTERAPPSKWSAW
jgi:hypothetical protein